MKTEEKKRNMETSYSSGTADIAHSFQSAGSQTELLKQRLIELLDASRDDDDKWIDGNGDYLSAGDITLLNTTPKVEVTEERLREAWDKHVNGLIPTSARFNAFKKELGL